MAEQREKPLNSIAETVKRFQTDRGYEDPGFTLQIEEKLYTVRLNHSMDPVEWVRVVVTQKPRRSIPKDKDKEVMQWITQRNTDTSMGGHLDLNGNISFDWGLFLNMDLEDQVDILEDLVDLSVQRFHELCKEMPKEWTR